MFKYPLSTSNYELLHLVGVGTYSRVYESNCRDNNQVIAVKQINLEEFPLELETIQRQTAFWSKCEHPNVVKYYASFIDGSTLWILNEYMGAGSLKDIIKLNYQNGFKNEQLIAALLAQVVMGVKFFHDNHEIHRDIRTNNILVNSEGFVKLGDFGLATSLVKGGTRQGSTLSLFGEECYMAPEVLRNENGYSEKTDIWSLGLTAIELGTGKMPYAGMKFMESLVQIIDHDPPSLPDSKEYSAAYKDFVKQCLNSDPSKRATAAELLNHRFIRQYTGSNVTSAANLLANSENSTSSAAAYTKQELSSKLPPLYVIFEKLHRDKDSLQISKNQSPSQMIFDFSVAESDSNKEKETTKDKEKDGHKHHHKHGHKHKHKHSSKTKKADNNDTNEEKKKSSHKRKHKSKSSDSDDNEKDSGNSESESQSTSYSESDSTELKKSKKSKKKRDTKAAATDSSSENSKSESDNSYSGSDDDNEKSKSKDKKSKKRKSTNKSKKTKEGTEDSSAAPKEEKKDVQKMGRFSVTRTESSGYMDKGQKPTVVASVSLSQSSSQNLDQKQRIEALSNEIASLGNELTRLENENVSLKKRLDEVVETITKLQNQK
ncbi:hypothetical protein M9Y10_005645 [Tritrichomonas musculus]|uniref:Protein kinase domain-containing protein n=1 Tax=Tritrichomonas musculus TaxID=1915356 RepID=A0ABR2JCA9_9EUKA